MGLITIYLAGPDGFSPAGLAWHRDVVIPAVTAAGFEAFSPWVDIGASGGVSGFADIEAMAPGPDQLAAYRVRSMELGRVNARAIQAAGGVLALLDGVDVDSGTAAEIGYAAALGHPVVGLRTDSRLSGDNPGVAVNLQVEFFIDVNGGRVCRSVSDAVNLLVELLGTEGDAGDPAETGRVPG